MRSEKGEDPKGQKDLPDPPVCHVSHKAKRKVRLGRASPGDDAESKM